MSNLSLMPVPAEQDAATCANCGAALAPDQRYCLECGQPASPVRLAFLDVLQAEQNTAGLGPSLIEVTPASYVAVDGEQNVSSWLRRNSGLLGLLTVLLMCLIVGLLVGHWVTQGKAPSGPTIVKVEGLSTAPVAAGTTPTSTAATSTTPSSSAASKSAAKEKEEAKTEAKETAAEKAPPPKPVELSAAKQKKLNTTTGKQHEEEVNALGDQPTISH